MNILCTVDITTREVTIPYGQRIASYDHKVDVIRFQVETIPGFSLDTSSIRIAAQGPNKVRHDYAVDPSTVAIEEETGYITFDWPIPASVTEMPIGTFKYGDKGQLIFAVCAEIISGNTVSKAWHSDDGIITVVAHLEPEAGGGEDPSETATNAQKIGQLQTDVAVVQRAVAAVAGGTPPTASTIAEMNAETSTVYIYTGSESGESTGYWYYYNGTTFVPGGQYGGAVTDTTLSISGRPADAKAVGDAIANITIEVDDTLSEQGKAADAKAVGEALAEKADADDVGDLSQLTTTAKDNLVAAITELKNDLNGVLVSNYVEGYGLDASGELYESANKCVSVEISISDIYNGSNRFYGGNISTAGDYYVAFYDSTHTLIQALQLVSNNTEYRSINWTTQISGTPTYVRFSFQKGYSAKITNNVNTDQVVYWVAESTTSEGLIEEVDGLQNEVDRMLENMPEEGQIDAIETAINGKSEQNYTEGYGLNADGTLYQNSNQSVSDKVPYTWTGTTRFTYGETSADYRICFYDENDTVLLTYVSSSNALHRNVSADSLETQPSYVRFSFKKGFASTLSENSNEESRITYYMAEETVTQGLVEKVSDIQTTMLTDYGLNITASADTLITDGTTLEVAENIDSRKNDVIEFRANIDSFTSLSIGHGYMISHGSWITIDATNVTVYADETAIQTAQYQHGLTFAHYINVLIKRGNEGKATIEITTGGSDLVYTQDNVTFFGSRGSVFAFCTGTLNSVKLSAIFKDFNAPIVIFGDSYQSVGSTARWPYYMINNGYTNYLLCGFPGANASHARLAFREIIKYIKPKYIVWCMGMNGSDSSEAVNATWKNSADEVVAYCEQNNVTPILATIPNVPDRIQTFKNAYTKSLGYRYIDFAKAVGAESQGSTWYTGMLSSDNLHPSSLGAKALYAQVLADFPEIVR